MNWFNVVPWEIGVRQIQWERNQTIVRMRLAGLTLASIGARYGITGARVRQILERHRRSRGRDISPVMVWYSTTGDDLAALAKLVKKYSK